MYKKLSNLKKHHRFLYTLLIALGLISLWRGAWRLSDIYLFGNDPFLTSMSSLVIGITILWATHHRLS